MIQDFSKPFDDCKAQPKAASLRAIGASVVLIEYVRKLVFGDTDAAVPDLDANFVADSSASKQDSPPVSVSDRIRQEIADHLR